MNFPNDDRWLSWSEVRRHSVENTWFRHIEWFLEERSTPHETFAKPLLMVRSQGVITTRQKGRTA